MAEFIATYIAISVVLYLMVRVGEKDGRRKHDQVLTSAELQRTDKGTFGPGQSSSAPVFTPMLEILPLYPDSHDLTSQSTRGTKYSGDFKLKLVSQTGRRYDVALSAGSAGQ